jgi:hypothetical protein
MSGAHRVKLTRAQHLQAVLHGWAFGSDRDRGESFGTGGPVPTRIIPQERLRAIEDLRRGDS